MKHVHSTDPRKKLFVDILKRMGAHRVTKVKETKTDPIVFIADAAFKWDPAVHIYRDWWRVSATFVPLHDSFSRGRFIHFKREDIN